MQNNQFTLRQLAKELYKMRYLISFVCGLIASSALVSCVSPAIPTSLPVSVIATPVKSHRLLISNTSPWREIWRKSVGTSNTSVPLMTVSGSTIVFPTEGYTATITSINARDGNTLWTENLGDYGIPSRRVTTVHSVFIDEKHVYVALSFAIMAFDLSNGGLIWTTERLPEHTSYYIFPAIDDNTLSVFGIYGDTLLYHIDVDDGQIKSTEKYADKLIMRTQTVEYVENKLDLLAIDRNTQQVLWTVGTRGSVGTRRWPVFADSKAMIFATGPGLGSLEAVDPISGQILWQTVEEIVSNFTLVDGSIYALKSSGILTTFDALTGRSTDLMEFGGGPLDIEHASKYGVFASNSKLFVYLGDSQELIAFSQE